LGESTLLVDVASEPRNSFDLDGEVELKLLFVIRDLLIPEHFEELGAELAVVERIGFNQLKIAVDPDVDMAGIRLKVNVGAADLDTAS
jgi:hypothetical protein